MCFNTVNGRYCCNVTEDNICTCGLGGFNTVNGRCCCFLIFVLPSLRSGTWDVRTSSSLCSSAVSHPSAHTVNGRCCCNYSIDHQTGYDRTSFNTVNGRCCYFITFVLPSLRSGTCDVWTSSSLCSSAVLHPAAHTVNGRYCCLIIFVLPSLCSGTWDVRTSSPLCSSAVSHPSAHTVNGRCCCNYNRNNQQKQNIW